MTAKTRKNKPQTTWDPFKKEAVHILSEELRNTKPLKGEQDAKGKKGKR